jgi:hypothetical protein
MFKKLRKIVVFSKYLPLSFDEVTMNDNQLWVSIHCYVIQHWYCLHVFYFLRHVNYKKVFDNLIKVIMDILKNHASVFNANVVKIM